MAQFTIYSSNDAGAPVLSGTVGSLLAILDACLVDGYGAKTAAGWSKPLANSGNCGHYLQGAGGSGYHLFINDAGPNVTAGAKEAWATGWKSMTSIAAPVGAGNGQFPTPTQLLTTGHVVIRKSISADSVLRQWIVVADALTVYLFIITGDVSSVNGFWAFFFGDIYSYAGSADVGRCMIAGRFAENVTTITGSSDLVGCIIGTGPGGVSYTPLQTDQVPIGHYIADSIGGGRGSGCIGKIGDQMTYYYSLNPGLACGCLPTPNPADQSMYFTPIFICDLVASGGALRGRMRGLWTTANDTRGIPTGTMISGTGDYSGKTFMAVRMANGAANLEAPFWVETSNTVDTN